MILTVTLNPALDKTAETDALKVNALNRLRAVRLDAGGKGVNVSAVILSLGGKSIATGFAGGSSGKELLSLIAQKGIEADFVRIVGATRTNLKIVDDRGGLTELNEPGPVIKTEEWHKLQQKLSSYGTAGNIIALSGSIPAGIGAEIYRNLSSTLRRSGAEVFLDADGDALKYALEGAPDEVPDYIKPNRHELLRYFGIAEAENPPETKLIALCRSLLDKGVKLIALSMGDKGALFVNKNGVWRSAALDVPVRSAVGAGDSMTGALIYGFVQRLPDERCFALSIAASAGACASEGTNPPSRAAVDALLTKTRIEKIG
jgi:1-phosphofructokinase